MILGATGVKCVARGGIDHLSFSANSCLLVDMYVLLKTVSVLAPLG